MLKALRVVTFLLISSCYADNFNCVDLKTEVCKTKLIENFNAEFKALHLRTFRKVLKTYIDISTLVKNELPKNDAFNKLVEESINNVANDLEKINQNIENDNELGKISAEAIIHIEFTYEKGTADPVLYRNLCKKHKLRESLMDALKELTGEIIKLWSKFYGGLRAEDLKAYAEYMTLNNLMEKITNVTDLTRKENDLVKVASDFGLNLKIPFIEEIMATTNDFKNI